MKKKCYNCRKEFTTKTGKIFCKKCEKDPKARKGGSSTLVIYHSV